MNLDNSFKSKIYKAVKNIPRGKVATYEQIARLAGSAKAYRAVGNTLHNNPDPKNILCYRVVKKDGSLAKNFSFGGEKEQKKLLQREGVVFIDNKVDLEKHLIK